MVITLWVAHKVQMLWLSWISLRHPSLNCMIKPTVIYLLLMLHRSTLVNISCHFGQMENIQMVVVPSVQFQVMNSHFFPFFFMFGMVTGLENFRVDFNLVTILLECLSVGFWVKLAGFFCLCNLPYKIIFRREYALAIRTYKVLSFIQNPFLTRCSCCCWYCLPCPSQGPPSRSQTNTWRLILTYERLACC